MSSTPSDSTPTRHDFHRKVEEVKPSKIDVNKMVMGYLINEGYPEAARKFASEANIQPPEAAAATSGEREEIKHAILAGSIELAIERINDLTDLLDRDTRLHFSLLRLQLTELIRKCMSNPNSDITPAIDFASSHLAPIAPSDPTFLSELERTMALLIFPPDNLSAPLAGLLDPELRQTVAAEVNQAILKDFDCAGRAQISDLLKVHEWGLRRAKEKKLPLPSEGVDIWGSGLGHNVNDGEDSVMND